MDIDFSKLVDSMTGIDKEDRINNLLRQRKELDEEIRRLRNCDHVTGNARGTQEGAFFVVSFRAVRHGEHTRWHRVIEEYDRLKALKELDTLIKDAYALLNELKKEELKKAEQQEWREAE